MTVRLNPYLSFRDNAREAMDYYHSVFGGELTKTSFDQMGDGAGDSSDAGGKLMHAMLETDGGLVLMASDTPDGMDFTPAAGFAISLSGDDESTLRRYWDALSDGGTVTMPLEPAPWGDTFGMCTDRFGIPWMVNILGASG